MTASIGHKCPPPPPGSALLTPEYKRAVQVFKDAAQGDLPKDRTKAWKWEMACAHDFLLGMFEGAYCFADEGAEGKPDIANYLGFAEVALYHIVSHHAFEEEMIFPEMVRASGGNTIWTRNVEQHHAFSEQIDMTWLYLRHCRANLSPPPAIPSPVPEPSDEIKAIDKSKFPILDFNKPFNPDAYRKHIDSYILILVDHLVQELDTLTPENMSQNDKALRADMIKHLQAYDPKWFLSSAFAAYPINKIKQLMPLPYILRRLLVPFYFAPKYYGFWLYCSNPEHEGLIVKGLNCLGFSQGLFSAGVYEL